MPPNFDAGNLHFPQYRLQFWVHWGTLTVENPLVVDCFPLKKPWVFHIYVKVYPRVPHFAQNHVFPAWFAEAIRWSPATGTWSEPYQLQLDHQRLRKEWRLSARKFQPRRGCCGKWFRGKKCHVFVKWIYLGDQDKVSFCGWSLFLLKFYWVLHHFCVSLSIAKYIYFWAGLP